MGTLDSLAWPSVEQWNQRLFQARSKVLARSPNGKGIGTLKERTLHAAFKYMLEPDDTKHEIKIGGYVADILNDSGIIEIQTRSFTKLKNKLEVFLKEYPVTVVYPVARVKWLIWIDEETGQATKKRKSPKIGTPLEIFQELAFLRPYLKMPNLNFCVLMTDIEEYRLLNGWSTDRKKGSTRWERIPIEIGGTHFLSDPCDYRDLMPSGLPQPFTSKDFKEKTHLSLSRSQTALRLLYDLGVVTRGGKRGNSHLYHTEVLETVPV